MFELTGPAFPMSDPLDWRLRAARVVGLVALVVSILRSGSRLGPPHLHVLTISLLALACVGWLLSIIVAQSRLPGLRYSVGAWALTGTAGAALAGISPRGAAIAFPAVALADAGARLHHRQTFGLFVAVAAGLAAGHAATTSAYLTLQLPVLLACALVGMLRQQYLHRAEQNELALSSAEVASQERARAATLAERSRIARELHDVQAHSFSALSVQLKVISALVEAGADREQLRPHLQQAEELVSTGLAETRHSVLALREQTAPVEDLLRHLVENYRDHAGATAALEVSGRSRNLRAGATMALYRSAQEALTNVRKHASGSPVTMRLEYRPREVCLEVANQLEQPRPSVADAPTPAAGLSGSGTGFGLEGLRERVAELGGALAAGPGEGRWTVALRIPS